MKRKFRLCLLTITGTLLIFITGCTPTPPPELKIGQPYEGGIICYIDVTGQHGLIAATKDQSSGIQWHNGGYIEIKATGTAVGTGQANTTAIVSAQGTGSYAASLCDLLTLDGYSDWFLPSSEELKFMYTNLHTVGYGGFASAFYWSSSEDDGSNARYQNFGNGSQGHYNKDGTDYVRAVRAF